jgi:hypothetical protein
VSTVDAVDAHAYEMFCAGWHAAMCEAGGYNVDVDDGGREDEYRGASPTAEQFYLAVPNAKARHCGPERIEP